MKRFLCTLLLFPLVIFPAHGADKTEEDPAATKLLKDARAARATWEGFPGFTANLTINHNGKLVKTKVEVHENGKVELNNIDDEQMKKYVRGQLISLVAHRLSTAAEKDTPCAFYDKNEDHPLGRKIKVLNDELHSSYRIKDDQIKEVNRQMKDSRFTITILKNYQNEEKQFLPAFYVVNMWQNKTNLLINSTSHCHTWKRVSKYDLPESLTIIIARAGVPADGPAAAAFNPAAAANDPNLDVWELTFSDHELIKQ